MTGDPGTKADGTDAVLELVWIDRRGRLRAYGQGHPVSGDTKQMVVLAGSIAWSHHSDSLDTTTRRRREQLLKDGTLAAVPGSGVWKLTGDVACSSTSQAARLLLGQSAQGPKWWTAIPADHWRQDLPDYAEAASDGAPANEHGDSATVTPPVNEPIAKKDPQRENVIARILDDFAKQREGYAKVLDRLEEDLRDLLKDGSVGADASRTLLPQVASRLKSPESLEEKLRSHDELQRLEDVKDLVGVRVVLYRDRDWKDAVAAVKLLPSLDQGRYAIDKDKSYLAENIKVLGQDSPRGVSGAGDLDYYRADHFQITITTQDGRTSVQRRAEVQITNLLDHLVNEISHDVLYKPRDVPATEGVREAFRALYRHMNNSRAFVDRLDEVVGAASNPVKAVDNTNEDLIEAMRRNETIMRLGYELDDSIGGALEQDWNGSSDRARSMLPSLLERLRETGKFAPEELEPEQLAVAISTTFGDDWRESLRKALLDYNERNTKPGRELNPDSLMDTLLVGVLGLGKSRRALYRPRGQGRPTVLDDIVRQFDAGEA